MGHNRLQYRAIHTYDFGYVLGYIDGNECDNVSVARRYIGGHLHTGDGEHTRDDHGARDSHSAGAGDNRAHSVAAARDTGHRADTGHPTNSADVAETAYIGIGL